jgi:hypothetical protein
VLLEEILRNATMTLLECSQYEAYTMAEIPLLLEDAGFRNHLVQKLTFRHVQNYWLNKYNRLSDKDQLEERRSTLNRINAFLTQPLVENIVGQAKTTIDFRRIMDERKILLVMLDRRMEDVTSLVGSMIIAELLDAAYSRTSLPIEKRKQFNLYADEFQLFATEDFATLLTEARKFGIATTIAHQIRDQLDTQNRAATLNVANLVVFKISGQDAQELAPEFNATPPVVTETRREAVLVPKQNVLDYVLNHGHPNPDVASFVTEYLQFLKDHEHLDTEVYQKYHEKYPHELHEVLKVDTTMASMTYGAKNKLGVMQWEDTYKFKARIPKEILPRLNTLMYQWMTNTNGDDLWTEMMAIIGELAGIFGYENYCETNINPKAPEAHEAKRKCNEAHEADNEWFRIHGNTASEEQKRAQLDKWEKTVAALTEVGITHIMNRYKVSYEQAKERYYRESKRWTDFMLSIRKMLDALRNEPIMTESGKYEEKPLAPRTYADMQNEIASTLANLPRFTARVKIASDTQTIEHTVKTLPPEHGIGRTALEQWKASIKAQNVQNDCYRSRKEVEEEITNRQQHASGAAPTQHARQVPVKGNCPQCGFSNNRPGANFCMQCGTKL